MQKVNSFLRSKGIPLVILTLLVVLPATFFFMPPETIFEGPTTCLSKRIWKKDCLGCGMTRATYSLMHLDFKTAHRMNWRVWLVGPLLVIYWGMLFWRFSKKIR